MKKKNLLKSCKVASIIETVVAFTILLLCLAMVTTCIRISGNLQSRALQRRQAMAQVEEALYREEYTAIPDAQGQTWLFKGNKISFTVRVDTQRAVVDDYAFPMIQPAEE